MEEISKVLVVYTRDAGFESQTLSFIKDLADVAGAVGDTGDGIFQWQGNVTLETDM